VNAIKQLFESIEHFFEAQETKRREAYLAQAQSIEDLERRMRALDSNSNFFLP